MFGACCGEDFLFCHLGHFQFALCVTLGFLHKSLTQCGLCLTQMSLISLPLPALAYFVLVHGFLEVGLMLSVSYHYVAQHHLTFSGYLRFYMLVSYVPSICQHKINGLFVHGQLLEMVLSNRWGVLVYDQIM